MASSGLSDEEVGRALHDLVRRVVQEVLDERQHQAATVAAERSLRDERPHRAELGEQEPPIEPLEGVRPYDLAAFAEHALRDGPLHVSVLARRCYALGFKHKWEPKHPNQLESSSLNQLVDRLPHKFERVAPGVLQLKPDARD